MADALRKKQAAPTSETPSNTVKPGPTKANVTKSTGAPTTPARTVPGPSPSAKPTTATSTPAKSTPTSTSSGNTTKPTPTTASTSSTKSGSTSATSGNHGTAAPSATGGAKSASGAPAPVKRATGSSENGDTDRQQEKKDTWMEAHWKRWSPQADKDRSYPVVFDKSPPAVKAKLIALLGGTEPKLTTMATALSYLEAASGKANPGPVQVALVEADDFDKICEALDGDRITIKVPIKDSKATKKRRAFVPTKEIKKA
ncbi:hypothetical protein F5144DRAFT_569647 [Chaetomium tenue]|uniref:Uncharacterized protein n=1 Tax=Chaetomium tenue TaxID=1854479 RepID=A0ACB7PFL2_9PEZI|nr:hypothetical protein F5144DRAFT_569647 [Chaetomium globosum]